MSRDATSLLATGSRWPLARVKDHFALISGYPFASEQFNNTIGTPLVRIRDIFSSSTEIRYAGPVVPDALIDTGDVLVGMDGEFNVAVWAGGKALLNQRVCCLRAKASIIQPFLAYYLPVPLRVINDLTHSTTVKHLSSSDVLDIRVPFPSVAEQIAIVAYLDRETAKIDAMIAAKERLLALLAEKRRALITHAVTRGLNPNAPTKDSGNEWLGKIPSHWTATRLKFLAEIRGGVTLGKTYGSAQLIDVPYLRVANVQAGFVDLTELKTIAVPAEERDRYLLRAGDLLMTEGGDIDKLGRGCVWTGQVAPCIHQNHVFAVRSSVVDPQWLARWTDADPSRAYFEVTAKRSTNLASISATNIGELPVVLPPQSEMIVLLQHLERETSRFDAVAESTRRTISLLGERRSALIAATIAGQHAVEDAL